MSSPEMKPTRYAHSEGHVDMTYDEEGRHLMTCGPDGDLRIYDGFEDDDPISHRIGEIVYSLAFKNNKFYAGADDNAVQSYLFKDGELSGLMTRFTAPVTHMCFNKSGTTLLAGSSDFTVKLIEVETNKQKVFQGHDAPILSVALHPKEHLIASSSCDGTVRIWQVEDQSCIKTIPGLPKHNDFNTAPTLCRLSWNKDGQHLVIPMDTEVRVYDTTSWQISYILTDSSITGKVSVMRFSPCWKFLAGACTDGVFVVWDFLNRQVITRLKNEKSFGITALSWNPAQRAQLAFCDNNGYLGLVENVVPDNLPQKETSSVAKAADPTSGLFDDDDDDMLMEATNPDEPSLLPPAIEGDDDDDDDDDEIRAIRALKKQVLMIDENSVDAASVITGKDDTDFVIGDASKTVVRPTYVAGFEPTPLQQPFQPSSSPVHLSHRFMVWNAVGVVTQYNTDEENSINIEFHDTAIHHAMHVTNNFNHTMAALSNEAVLLACESDEDSPSKFVCMHFASWDNNKEWTVDMPEGEDIKAVCLGDGWAAIATDKRCVRLFTVGGVQKEMFSIPGPVVALSAHGNQLMIIYHAGMGIPGDQCLGVRLQLVSGPRQATKLNGEPLPINPKSTLTWIGFSAEGTPFTMDSAGVIRMLNRNSANCWTQIANLRKHCKGKSDNFWICSMHENPQQIRAVLCKGARYPPTVPRPNVQIMPYQLPLCEMSTDKGEMEENLLRHKLLCQHTDWWDSQGFEVDEEVKSNLMMPQQEALMKLFALACKSDREVRAVELCELMPNQHTVQLAIKYASRLRMVQLAQRLNDVVREKAEEEAVKAQRALLRNSMNAGHEEEEEEEEEQEDFRQYLEQSHSHIETEWSHNKGHKTAEQNYKKSKPTNHEEDMEDDEDEVNMSADIYEEIEEEKDAEKPKTPLLMFGPSKNRETIPKTISTSQNAKKNPFKTGSQKTPTSCKGTSVFDSMEKQKSKSSQLKSPEDQKWKRKKTVTLKKPKPRDQQKFFASKKENEKSEPSSETTNKPKTGFQLWLDQNKTSLLADNPGSEDSDLTLLGVKAFKQLDKEEQQEWNDKAKSDADSRKRKRDDEESQELSEVNHEKTPKVLKQVENDALKTDGKLSQNTSSKLNRFALQK